MLDSLLTTIYTATGKEQAYVLENHDNGGTITIAVTTFEQMFGKAPYTYATLSATPQAKAGWQTYFDQWKAQGLIS